MLKDDDSATVESVMTEIERKRMVSEETVDDDSAVLGKRQRILVSEYLDQKCRQQQNEGRARPAKRSSSEKVEAFDAFHKMLNSCTGDSSFNVSDAATLLRQMTPSNISSVLQLVSQKIVKTSASDITDTAIFDSRSTRDADGDEEIMLIVSESQAKDDVGRTLTSIGSNSCSPISAAVQALMSFNANDSYLKISLKGEGDQHSDNTPASDNVSSFTSEAQAENIREECLASVDGVDITTSLRSAEMGDAAEKLEKESTHLFTPIISASQVSGDRCVSSSQLIPELLIPNLSSIVTPFSVAYTFPSSYQSFIPSSVDGATSASGASLCVLPSGQKQSVPRPILPKPSDSLLGATLTSLLQKGIPFNGSGYVTSSLMSMPVESCVSLGQPSFTEAICPSQTQLVSNAGVGATGAIMLPKSFQQQPLLQLPADTFDLQQLFIRAQLSKAVESANHAASSSRGNNQSVAEDKGDSENCPDENVISKVIKVEDVANPCNLEVAASALLSIGVSTKDNIPSYGTQVVAAFNREKATYDLKEFADANKNDVLYTSTGTFQIEDVEIDPRKNKIEKDNYECGKCKRVFTSIIYLARHIKRVCPDMSHRKWKCDRCEKAFRHPFGLQQHIYTHTGERPFKCEQCAKAFYSANDLRRHKRTHSGERPYLCSHCTKTFSTTISLKTHTYIHTGERPHKCPACPKTFATSSKLSRHVVTHSDRRPFSCDLCPKTFNRSGDLRRHYNNVHGQEHKLIECNECNKVFATQQCLHNHRLTHNRDAAAPTATNVIRIGI